VGLNWTELLDPANGGPGESPGYRETLERIAERPYVKPADRPKTEKGKKK
jgi:hypothetical protein